MNSRHIKSIEKGSGARTSCRNPFIAKPVTTSTDPCTSLCLPCLRVFSENERIEGVNLDAPRAYRFTLGSIRWGGSNMFEVEEDRVGDLFGPSA